METDSRLTASYVSAMATRKKDRIEEAILHGANGFFLAAHLYARDKNPEWLARELGMQRSGVWKWCVGDRQPPERVVRERIATLLDISEAQLWHKLGWKDLNRAASGITDISEIEDIEGYLRRRGSSD